MDTHDLGALESLEHASPEELRVRLHALAVLLARAPVPIAVAHDPQCRFVSANPALARLLGLPPGANVSLTPPSGQTPPYRICRQGQDLPPEELPMQYAIAHRTSVRNEIEIVRADGSIVYVQNDVEPLYDETGAVTGCISVCVDLTEQKHASDLFRELDRRKDEFLATLSHELRNPLAPIRNAVELLRERIDLRAVVQGAVESAQPHIDAVGHTLTVRQPPEAVWLDADFTRLAQAFSNLLNNAVKYTDPGGRIAIAARVEGDKAVVSVTDTGVGIPPELVPGVFNMFTQLDHSRDRARGGLGIGLALARRLVELHGGTIEACSEGAGAGCTFTVRLPLAVQEARTDRVQARQGAATPRACRILVVEDSADAAEMLRMMLAYTGHDVRVASDGLQAVAIASEFRPHLALIDIAMPRLDGYETARRLRAAHGARVVLVALTGWGQDEDKERARDAGFDHHLIKPADPDVLHRLIADVVCPS